MREHHSHARKPLRPLEWIVISFFGLLIIVGLLSTLGDSDPTPSGESTLIEDSSQPRPSTPEQVTRWRERQTHVDNIRAFQQMTTRMYEDRIISPEESEFLCFAHPQWQQQLVDARDYVIEYQEVDPDDFEHNKLLLAPIQEDADAGLEFVAYMREQCEQ